MSLRLPVSHCTAALCDRNKRAVPALLVGCRGENDVTQTSRAQGVKVNRLQVFSGVEIITSTNKMSLGADDNDHC